VDLIPADKEREALRRHRGGEAVAETHRWLWPGGNAAVSHSLLATVLRTLADAEDDEAPADDLPDDLEAALGDLADSRAKLMDAIRGDGPEGDGCNPLYHSILVQNVKAMIALSQHRIELHKHRITVNDRWPIKRRH
jgi:hypothetical protein